MDLRDTIWQFIFGFLGIAVAILVYLSQRRKKSLSYQVVSETALLTVQEGLEDKIKILFGENPVRDVHLVVLRILNDGSIPIVAGDFAESVAFSFGKDATVLSAEVIDTVPKTLKPTVTSEAGRVVFQPTLLNGGDVVSIKLLLAQYKKTIECSARIAGVRDVKRVNEGFRLSGIYPVIGLLVSVSGIVLLSALLRIHADASIRLAFFTPAFVLQFIIFIALSLVGIMILLSGTQIGGKNRTR
jgi:hypothetical protein